MFADQGSLNLAAAVLSSTQTHGRLSCSKTIQLTPQSYKVPSRTTPALLLVAQDWDCQPAVEASHDFDREEGELVLVRLGSGLYNQRGDIW